MGLKEPSAERSAADYDGAGAYTSNARSDAVTPAFEQAFQLAFPPPPELSQRKASLQLLGDKVTRVAIVHWRKGRRKPPAWAIDRVTARLRESAYTQLAVADSLQAQKEKSAD